MGRELSMSKETRKTGEPSEGIFGVAFAVQNRLSYCYDFSIFGLVV